MIRITKILHVCLGNYYADDFGYQENLITKYHKLDGLEVSILASRLNYDPNDGSMFLDEKTEYRNRDGIKVKRIDYRFCDPMFRKLSRILKMYEQTYLKIEEEQPDIMFLHNAQFRDLLDVIKYKKRNPEVKIYVDNHADYINSAKTFLSKNVLHRIIWRYYIKRLEPYCEQFWGVTPNRCDFLIELYDLPPDKVDLLPMGADTEKIEFENQDQIRKSVRARYGISEKDFVLVSGGKIDERKKIHHLIQAVNELGNPNIKLLLFGAPNRQMQMLIESLTNSKYVKMAGWVSPDAVYDYFLAADLGVFPGTHSVLWEQAVGSGLPCIFKKWPGMTHVDVGGNAVFILNSDIETIKNEIRRIYEDLQVYVEMRNAAIGKGIPKFSYKEISRRAIRKNQSLT